jgi:hypothetical protein
MSAYFPFESGVTRGKSESRIGTCKIVQAPPDLGHYGPTDGMSLEPGALCSSADSISGDIFSCRLADIRIAAPITAQIPTAIHSYRVK